MYYNWNVIGHEKELGLLERDFRENNIHHAYLFVGPEKVGKFRVAKSVAGILQCPENFCHSCLICSQIEKKCHPDIIELEDDGQSIKIDAVRDIIARLNMTSPGRYKILLIQNIGRLTEEAGNCLLKTLEEPPQKTIFLFTVSQLRDIMPTIASRMRIVHFKKLPDEILREALKKLFPDVDEDTLDQALLLSLGRSGKAIQLLRDPETFQEVRELYRLIQFLDENATPATRLTTVQEISQDAQKMRNFLLLLVHYFRRKMFGQPSKEKKQASIQIIREIHRVMDLASRNVNPRLLMENLMLQL